MKAKNKMIILNISFWSENLSHVEVVVNNQRDSKNYIFQPIVVKDQNFKNLLDDCKKQPTKPSTANNGSLPNDADIYFFFQ